MAAGDVVVTICGNATNDAELKFIASGKAVANWTVVSNPRVFDKQENAWKDGPPLFLRCSIWGQPAEHVAESVTRGTRLIVTGRLKQRSYEKDSVQHTVVELEADEVAVSLKFAVAKVTKADRTGVQHSASGGGGFGSSGADDPWGSTPPAGGSSGYADSAPPF